MPTGPSGRPTSVEVSTSPDSWASPWPSWEPKAIPPIEPIIASSGPACAFASAGSPSTQARETCSAMGEHNFSQVGMVASIHCRGVQAVEVLTAAGIEVAPSSHTSASAIASATFATSTEDAGCDAGTCEVAICRARS